jgi:Na+-transporting NADH:ubiquinone oxidoreductase subunit C
MAKFKCTICGYIHEGDNAPEKCPICDSPSSKFKEINEVLKKKGFDTSSNTYTIIFSAIVVIIVAFLLAFVFRALKPMQDTNVALDKKKQILASLNIRDSKDAAKQYDSIVIADEIIDDHGLVIKDGQGKEKDGFMLNSSDYKAGRLALYLCKVNGEEKYVIPVYGMGLWGPIWGYIALNRDKNTVYGAFFDHESETAGLGARIKDIEFQQQFCNKRVSKQGSDVVSLSVIKKNAKHDNIDSQCDGITGATLTSNGVDAMLKECLGKYKAFLIDK